MISVTEFNAQKLVLQQAENEYLQAELWNCQEMCSRRIPKIMDRKESGGVMRELL